MPIPADEPRTAGAVTAWVREHARDRFAGVYAASEAHRIEHGEACTVYASSNGPLLATLAAACGARRSLEVGTGLGYSALHLADGSWPGGVVHTIERDASHAELALAQIEAHGMGDRVSVIAWPRRLPGLDASFDLIFNDAELEEYEAMFEEFVRLLRPGGLLITSNLFLAQYADDITGIEHAIAYRERLVDDARLRTAFLPSGLALSVRRA